MTLCEENCKLIYYNYETEKVKCSCDVKINMPLLHDIKFDKKELYKRFIDIKDIINIKVIKCFKAVFNGSLIQNYGFFIMLIIILLFIICLTIFSANSYDNLKMDINEIIIALKSKKPYIQKKLTINNTRKKRKVKSRKSVPTSNYLSINKLNDEKIEVSNINNDIIYKKDAQDITQNKSLNDQQILDYKDFELNLLEYKEALKTDKRTYFQFYISLLKSRHLFIFSFWPVKDYNSRIIKIFLFFFYFSIHLTVNALFFNDSTMHKIYEDKGSYNFIYQIPQIIYSSLISGIINILIKYLALSQDSIVKLKQEKNKE